MDFMDFNMDFNDLSLRIQLADMEHSFKNAYYYRARLVKEDWEYINQAQEFMHWRERFKFPLESPLSLRPSAELKQLKKSNSHSTVIRERGNKFYKKRMWEETLKYFTEAIAFAMPGSQELAFAYANRSAALFERELYKECSQDLERALSFTDYPVDKKEKLLNRQSNAAEKLSESRKVIYHEPEPTIENKNPAIEAAADCVKISTDEKYGRLVEATRDIEPGEIICVEKAYAVATPVEGNSRYIYCSYCADLCLNLIPCGGCIFSLYCSERCRYEAFNEYHDYECIIMKHYPTHFNEDDHWAQLSLKVLLKGLKERKNSLNDDSGIYRSNRFKEISELVCHMDKLSKDVIFEMALPLARIYTIIKDNTQIMEECGIDEKTLKTLLVRNKVIHAVNNVEITSYDTENELIHMGIAAGMWSFYNIFNHSCVRNVGWSFYGSTLVVRAERKIPMGSQLFACIGPTYLSSQKDVRQKTMKLMQMFTCSCEACTEDWPTYDQMQIRKRPVKKSVNTKLQILMLKNVNTHPVDPVTRERILKKIFKLAAEIENEEPSESFYMLSILYEKLLFVGNNRFHI